MFKKIGQKVSRIVLKLTMKQVARLIPISYALLIVDYMAYGVGFINKLTKYLVLILVVCTLAISTYRLILLEKGRDIEKDH